MKRKPRASHSLPEASLREFYQAESARIRQAFETTGDGVVAALERAALADVILKRLSNEDAGADTKRSRSACLLAVGGYGRWALFPHSDVDLLFLFANKDAEESCKESVAGISRTLWDLGMRASAAVRTLEECDELDRKNPEFSISLLDCRFLAGDAELYRRLHEDVLPKVVAREQEEMVRQIAELTRERYHKHGDTIYHLEPNLKDAPGGLRDYHLAGWLTLLSELENQRWVTPEGRWPAALAAECGRAFEFLCAARCFLHYRQGRDANHLSYEFQAEAAAQGIGDQRGHALPAEQWMRIYFRHARAIHRLATQLLDEATAAHAGLFELFEEWRSRVSNQDFLVSRGRVILRRPAALQDLGVLLGLFEFLARHGLTLGSEAEQQVEKIQSQLPGAAKRQPGLWAALQKILVLPHAAESLRTMHRLGVLCRLFPEFGAIDSLVIRDFYHRYTVDEHSFQTIQNLHRLRRLEGKYERRFGELFAALEQPELLLFAQMFHDVGKGMPVEDHIQGSLHAVEKVFSRLEMEPADRDVVRFLISQHLLMSATLQRRDIFDPDTVHKFAEAVGTPERLKMLCLFTYADIRAVNPEALTPWKAEMLWQLYMAAANVLTRSLDDDRVHVAAKGRGETKQAASLPKADIKLREFLEGFPRRYLATHPAEEIVRHGAMARRLAESKTGLRLRIGAHHHELTVVTRDRAFLFASITGVLTGWGFDILKAEAFANQAGVVVDTFRFADPHRTLELNPSEVPRFEQSMRDVLEGRVNLEGLMSGRLSPASRPATKVEIPTEIRFDDESSSHSTLLELITQDRPGLLFEVSSALAEQGCNIEVALIDTEGQKVIDVFYLTVGGAKLGANLQERLRAELIARL